MAFGRLEVLLFCTASRTNSHSLRQVISNGLSLVTSSAHFVIRVLQKKAEASEYHKLLMSRLKEQRERRSESLAKKRAVRMASQASAQETTTGKQPAT
jgi:hypothetical protein